MVTGAFGCSADSAGFAGWATGCGAGAQAPHGTATAVPAIRKNSTRRLLHDLPPFLM